MNDRPNVLFVFADQWRAQATGYAGDPNVRTPHLDRLAEQSVDFRRAVSGCPVCSPARASYLTGLRPLTHGVFVNDTPLGQDDDAMGRIFARAGYETAWIGKWHVDGQGSRSGYIPPQRRQGFAEFQALECTHDYRNSHYYRNNDPRLRTWEGYDAFAQTDEACRYIRAHAQADAPWLMGLSWGPPHGPCPNGRQNAPEGQRKLYDPSSFELRPNVPEDRRDRLRNALHNYYAHCTALDECIGRLLTALEMTGQAANTIVLFTSDHGDMLDSHGQHDKQRPWDESIRVPFLVHWPAGLGTGGRRVDAPIDCPDVLPTLLGLCGLDVPETMEGVDYADCLRGGADPSDGVALITCPHPFGNFNRIQHGGREYRAIRTPRHTYVRTLDGPWLLYDNEADPYQLRNRADDPAMAGVQAELDATLQARLDAVGDEFLPGDEYVRRWGYELSDRGTPDWTW